MGLHDRDLTAADAVLVCVARGHGDRWEALCLDYDIAVQGTSLPEGREKLELALHDYVAAEAEAEPARSQLLGRRAPFFVRLSWGFRFLVGTIFGRNRDGDSTVGFPVTCHAWKCTFREFIAVLDRNGFLEVRQTRSHRRFRGVTGGQVRMVTVAYHVIGDEITPNVLASMIRQSGLPRELFRK